MTTPDEFTFTLDVLLDQGLTDAEAVQYSLDYLSRQAQLENVDMRLTISDIAEDTYDRCISLTFEGLMPNVDTDVEFYEHISVFESEFTDPIQYIGVAA